MHKTSLEFSPQVNQADAGDREKIGTRKRYLVWFSNPLSLPVRASIGRVFGGLEWKHFPKPSELSRVFRSSAVELNYSCAGGVDNIVVGSGYEENTENDDINKNDQ